MDPSTLVLIITLILALIGFAIILTVYIIQLNNESGGSTGTTGGTGFVCSGPGPKPLTSQIPAYTRISPKSTAQNPISTANPPFKSVKHPVQRLYRAQSLSGPISPNHWLGNAMYGTTETNLILVYPYLTLLSDTGFKFGWPDPGTLTQTCPLNVGPCLSGYANLFYNSGLGQSIDVSCFGATPVSSNILDTDAMVGVVAWQYQNQNQSIGEIRTWLAQGSPFITMQVTNVGVAWKLNFTSTLVPYSGGYLVQIDSNTGYLVMASPPITASQITSSNGLISIPYYQGIIRVGYYGSQDVLDQLFLNYSIYPIESTIGTTSTEVNNVSEIQTKFEWTVQSMDATSDNLLMLSLPHQVITDVVNVGPSIPHPILGPTQLVQTNLNDEWTLKSSLPLTGFEYPLTGLSPEDIASLTEVWQNESNIVFNNPPAETVAWCQWLGSVATLLQIGKALNQDIGTGQSILINNLNSIRNTNGQISIQNTLVYDTTWGGILGSAGLNVCNGDVDSGNSFYRDHVGQYGYLIYAYAVAGYLDSGFLSSNTETALLFARTIMNPYQNDTSFPLWRNKHWYLGYSVTTGLEPGQSRGKNTGNIGATVLGYYGTYLLSTLLSNSELKTWSLALLSTEIDSLHTWFQYFVANKITVDPAFVQGTITERGDSYYRYTVPGGNLVFPARNASIMVPVMKPLTLTSSDYLAPAWVTPTQPFMVTALNYNLELESLAYANALIAVGNPDKSTIIQTIVDNSIFYLPYGSTWSSILYWVLTE